MKPRERVQVALRHQEPDRVPRFEIWIDALLAELGQKDPQAAYANLGQDCVMLPSRQPPHSNAWGDGVDEWGRVWRGGMYRDGMLDTQDDLRRYRVSPDAVDQYLDGEIALGLPGRFPDHCLMYGTHVGPFTASYLAMGFGRFFTRIVDDLSLVQRLMEDRTEWCIALFSRAVELGAEVIVMGEDSAHRGGPMISPHLWRTLVFPHHRRIVDALPVPVIWHSDGDIRPLLPWAVEAGFAGVHGLEPAAGVDLAQVKRDWGQDLVLLGNLDVAVLCQEHLPAVRAEVDRCLEQGAPGGGYLLATCNSIFAGMDSTAVAEYFRYAAVAGTESQHPGSQAD